MSEEKNKKFSPLLPLLIIIVCIVLGYLLINPFIQEIKQINTDIAAKNEEITAMEKKISDLKYLKTKFEETKDELDFLNVAFPTDKKIDEFIIQLTNMANDASIDIKSIIPSKKKSGSEIEIVIDTIGNYENLMLFVEYLEKNCRLIDIKSISINSEESGELTGFVDAKITVNIIEVSSIESEISKDNQKK